MSNQDDLLRIDPRVTSHRTPAPVHETTLAEPVHETTLAEPPVHETTLAR
nr:hypothetical protein [uncultured Actinoplanes sp.]